MRIANTAAWAALFLAFPVFFLYQAAVAFGAIPPVLGGGFTLALAVALVAVGPFLLPSVARQWPVHLPVVLLAALVVVIALYYYRFGEPYQSYRDYFIGSLKLAIGWGGLYCIGLAFQSSDRMRPALVVSVVAMAAIVPLLVQTPAMSLDWTERLGWNVASYQFFANALGVPAIFALALSWRTKGEPLIAAVPVVALYYMLSRSEFAGIVSVFCGWVILCAIHQRGRVIAHGVGAVAVLFVVSFGVAWLAPVQINIGTPQWVADAREPTAPAVVQPGTSEATVAERQSEVFALEESESWAERKMFFFTGIDDIKRSPIFGDYAGQIRDHGKAGTYMHTVLSVWRQFGVVPYILFAGLSAVGGWLCIRELLIKRVEDPMWILAGFMVGYTVLLMVFTKSVFWPLPALAWGLVAGRFKRA